LGRKEKENGVEGRLFSKRGIAKAPGRTSEVGKVQLMFWENAVRGGVREANNP